ncbi:MAG: hypothetical protein NVS4B10_11160 [Myxococcales bacterium]
MNQSATPRDRQKPLRFLFVGAWNTLFGVSFFAALYWATRPISAPWLAVAAVAQLVAVANAFATYKLFVFRTRGNVVAEYLRFLGAYSLLMAAQLALMTACVSLLHMPPVAAQCGVTAVSVVVSFFTHDRLTFRRWRNTSRKNDAGGPAATVKPPLEEDK